jgi:hypothetical protein
VLDQESISFAVRIQKGREREEAIREQYTKVAARRTDERKTGHPCHVRQRPMTATAEDISRAIDALPSHEFVRLKDYAENRIFRITPRAANGRTDDDLLQEAVIRLFDGTRHWDADKVGIVLCLIGAMRSISSAWAGHRKRNASLPDYAVTESKMVRKDEDGNLISPFDTVKASGRTAEDSAIDHETEAELKARAEQIEALCIGDDAALKVLAAFHSGSDGPTIQTDLGWTETAYRTTVRRIKRRAHKLAERHYGKRSA